MKSLYAKFMKEYNNTEVIETDKGFYTYMISDNNCYVENLFVLPEYRKCGIGTQFAKEIESIAKNNECKYIICAVNKDANNHNRSSLFIRNNEYLIDNTKHNAIYYKKEL